MADQELEQHEENANDFQEHWGVHSGSIDIDGTHASELKEQEKAEEKKEKDREFERHLHLSHMIYEIGEDIQKLQEFLQHYKDEMADLRRNAAINAAMISKNTEVQDAIKQFQAEGKTRLDILKESYGDKTFATGDENTWNALQNNILTDDYGRMVYRDENHLLYFVESDPDTGAPTRQYYTDANTITNLMHQAYAEKPPKLFGNETLKSEDPTNTLADAHNQWVYLEIKNPDGTPAMKTLPSEAGHYAGSIETMGDAMKVCSSAYACLLVEKLEIDQKIEVKQQQIDTTQEQIDLKTEQLDILKTAEAGGTISAEDLAKLERLEKEILKLEEKQATLEEDYAKLSKEKTQKETEAAQEKEYEAQSQPILLSSGNNPFGTSQTIINLGGAPSLEPDLAKIELQRALKNRMEGGVITANAYDDIMDNAPAEMKAEIEDWLKKNQYKIEGESFALTPREGGSFSKNDGQGVSTKIDLKNSFAAAAELKSPNIVEPAPQPLPAPIIPQQKFDVGGMS